MVLLGGAVRLTGSGLSMVDWRPIMGVLPPLGNHDWAMAFAKYQQFPEYRLVNQSMGLEEFKVIFFMEYFHRLLGRLIGVVFFLPFLWFLFKGYLSKALKPHLWLLLGLGACQGLMGWYMVKSGLVDQPHVSQYRLTAHLLLAVVIYVWLLRVLVGLSILPEILRSSSTKAYLRNWSAGLLLLTILMIASGGFMAGAKAGFIYNTWPQMGADWAPNTVWAMVPWWQNLFENPVTIQFVHRWLAIIVLANVLLFVLGVRRSQGDGVVSKLALLAGILIVVQLTLGIVTLIYSVPTSLGVAHQAGALLLIGVITVVWAGHLRSLAVAPNNVNVAVPGKH